MVVLNKIYTRTGDQGDTALGSGERVPKDALRIEAYGTVDEANAAIGVARGLCTGVLLDELARIQNDLFDLGADLCRPPVDGDQDAPAPLRMVQAQTDRLEAEIDQHNENIEPLRSFILPGGSKAAAFIHVARTLVRRAERRMISLSREEHVTPEAMRYINRLSDYLFVVGRVVNDQGRDDILWTPGANR